MYQVQVDSDGNYTYTTGNLVAENYTIYTELLLSPASGIVLKKTDNILFFTQSTVLIVTSPYEDQIFHSAPIWVQ